MHQIFAHEVVFHFLAADIGEHLSIDFDAGRKRLTTLLLHFPPKRRVLDDVLLLIRQAILGQDCPDTSTPAAMGFQIGDNLRFIHNAELNDHPIRDCCNHILVGLLAPIARPIFFFGCLERLFQTNHIFAWAEAVERFGLAAELFV